MNNKINKRINNLLIKAKYYSNRGHQNRNYSGKDALIKEAMSLIDNCFNYINWRYGIKNGVIYFDTKIGGKRFQISFHIFGELKKMNGRGRQTTWTGKRHASNKNREERDVLFYKKLKELKDCGGNNM